VHSLYQKLTSSFDLFLEVAAALATEAVAVVAFQGPTAAATAVATAGAHPATANPNPNAWQGAQPLNSKAIVVAHRRWLMPFIIARRFVIFPRETFKKWRSLKHTKKTITSHNIEIDLKYFFFNGMLEAI
jgi:hypothetical protein